MKEQVNVNLEKRMGPVPFEDMISYDRGQNAEQRRKSVKGESA